MTAKEYLRSIRNADENINYRLSEISKLRAEITSISPKTGGERVQTSGDSDPMKAVDRLVTLEAEINAEIDRYTELKVKAREMISQLPNDRHRAILTEYYLNHKTWEQVAEYMNISNRHAKRLHGWALQEFSEMHKDVLVCHP